MLIDDFEPEPSGVHGHASGWYSEGVMAQVFRVKHTWYKLDMDNPLLPNRVDLM